MKKKSGSAKLHSKSRRKRVKELTVEELWDRSPGLVRKMEVARRMLKESPLPKGW